MQLDKFEVDLKLDTPTPWGYFFQDSATPQMEGIEELHNSIMFYLAIILFTVTWIMITTIHTFVSSKSIISHKYMNHGKFVPIQKCSILNTLFINKPFVPTTRSCCTLSNNPSDNNNNNDNDTNYAKKYEDAYVNRKNFFKDNKSKSGIYMLTNKLTNDIYIGQSIDISKRFKKYFSLSYIKSKDSFIINRALIKYGYSNFSVTILEYCDKSDLLIREQYYFDKLNPQYNILKKAGSSQGYKHSEETKVKISKSLKGFYVNEKSALFGRIHTEETELKLSAFRGNLVNIYEKCSSEGFELIGSFVSARRAGKFLGISGSTIIRYFNSGQIFKYRYKFSSK
jgi:Cytochrome C oxidase subunit II, transmembrane domain/GIY-YIG catalytic domain/NUMOD3 motif